MAKLILSLDGLVLKEIPLTKERTTIGRKPHNDIQIDNLAVSGEHAMIVTILNDSFLEDLGSTNGTLVNGKPIKKHFLQNNDVVELGKYKLKYVGEAAPAGARPRRPTSRRRWCCAPRAMKAAAEQARAMAAAGGQPRAAQAMRSRGRAVRPRRAPRQPVSPTRTAAPARLRAPARRPRPRAQAQPPRSRLRAPAPQASRSARSRSSPARNAGKELELTKPLTTLGKPGVQVAVITRRPQGYFITHVEGANRPAVNGKHDRHARRTR